jgi:hypothetical protein
MGFNKKIQGLFPLGSCFVMTYYTYQAVSGYQVVKFVPSADELTGDGHKRKHRLIGKWKRQLDVYDSECSTSMRYLMLFSTAFNDMR